MGQHSKYIRLLHLIWLGFDLFGILIQFIFGMYKNSAGEKEPEKERKTGTERRGQLHDDMENYNMHFSAGNMFNLERKKRIKCRIKGEKNDSIRNTL